MQNSQNVIGVDIGGTFTDLVGYVNEELVIAKTLTTPANPALGVAKAIELSSVPLSELNEFLHGSTIAINTVLEKKGAKTALLTTVGFRDIYEIGRGNRPEAFDLNFTRPKPLIPRNHRFEVNERLNAKGEVLMALQSAEILALGERLLAQGIESVAICFLHAYANPAHELLAGQLLRQAHPDLFVTLSHEILREFREYERTSTTVLNAYVGPRVKNYLNHLSADLKGMGYQGHTHIMRSNGGSMSLTHACREPVSMMESGPVAGMIAAGHVAQILGFKEAIGFDMGGTTAKATLIIDGIPAIDEGYYIGGYASGQPMQLPVVSIVEVGSGGGSIAWRDRTGGLHVGPTSASAAASSRRPAQARATGEGLASRPSRTGAAWVCSASAKAKGQVGGSSVHVAKRWASACAWLPSQSTKERPICSVCKRISWVSRVCSTQPLSWRKRDTSCTAQACWAWASTAKSLRA